MRKFVVATVEDGQVKYCTKEWNYKNIRGIIPILETRKEARIYDSIELAISYCDDFNSKYKETKPYFVMQI